MADEGDHPALSKGADAVSPLAAREGQGQTAAQTIIEDREDRA